MPDPTRRRRPHHARTSKVDVGIFAIGLVAAACSSVVAYRHVGPYGDGPLNVGLYRTQDTETGKQLVYRDVRNSDGTVMRYLFDDAKRNLQKIQVMRLAGGKIETVTLYMSAQGLTRVDAGNDSMRRDTTTGTVRFGFSVRGDGIIDAWEYRGPKGQLLKIEVSRRRNGKIDRWEYYENEQLSRVEEDENHDGRIDHWLNYEAGILVKETKDKDGDGRPDPG